MTASIQGLLVDLLREAATFLLVNPKRPVGLCPYSAVTHLRLFLLCVAGTLPVFGDNNGFLQTGSVHEVLVLDGTNFTTYFRWASSIIYGSNGRVEQVITTNQAEFLERGIALDVLTYIYDSEGNRIGSIEDY